MSAAGTRADGRRGRGGSPRVVAIGGGHGLAVTLRALRLLDLEPTAIVTVADDGGSSGRLRRDLGMLPPGDLRRALLALAGRESVATALFAYRFRAGDLAGHNLGNLALAALSDLEGGFLGALAAASGLLEVRGRVLPSTLEPVRLEGLVRGEVVRGQAALARAEGAAAVDRVWLVPPDPPALAAAVDAVERADVLLLGPGSTFTSVAPNLLVPGLGRALAGTRARVAYVCNLEPDVTSSRAGPAAHLGALLAHCPGLAVPLVLCHSPAAASADGGRDGERLGELGAAVVHADVADTAQPARHDPDRLAAALKALVC
ncbi:MAG TPA: uridine diphosphate-N-acetylglucosamine-binding protein YvcK [Actinomycetes bacterium]|nr:uridine diphosphate-N-acetylglucosamine-binding protein YvcK [Actinomycetes bacterium]